jgi:hypothetical protein
MFTSFCPKKGERKPRTRGFLSPFSDSAASPTPSRVSPRIQRRMGLTPPDVLLAAVPDKHPYTPPAGPYTGRAGHVVAIVGLAVGAAVVGADWCLCPELGIWWWIIRWRAVLVSVPWCFGFSFGAGWCLEISEGEILNIQRTTVAVSIATLRL